MKYSDFPQIAIVPTYNPPVVGVWLWCDDWSRVEKLDDMVHRWSMQQLLRRAEER
jgi:hypothetical protein